MAATWWEVRVDVLGRDEPLELRSRRGRCGDVPEGAWPSLEAARRGTVGWRGRRAIVRVERGPRRVEPRERELVGVRWEVDGRRVEREDEARRLAELARERGRPGRLVRVSRYQVARELERPGLAEHPALLRGVDGLVYVWR
jgi:hypothetical protein